MKKLLILLLLPILLVQCKKDPNPENNQISSERKCFLTRIDDDESNTYSLYERLPDDKLSKVSTYYQGKVWEVINYSYNGSGNIHTKERFGVYDTANGESKLRLYQYSRYYKQGNEFIESYYGVEEGKYLPVDSTVYELNNDGTYKKSRSYAYDKSTKEYKYRSYQIYEYQADTTFIKRLYVLPGDVLLNTDTYSLDNKKNPMLYFTVFPLPVKQNYIRETRVNNVNQTEIQNTYTYNTEGYPATSSRSGASPLRYTYDCK